MKNNIRQQKSLLALVVVKGCVANEHFYSATWVKMLLNFSVLLCKFMCQEQNRDLKIYHLRKSK